MDKRVKDAKRKTVMRASDSYLFHDKHPLIDKLRTLMQDEGVTYQTIHEKTGVSVSTLTNWFSGAVKRPHAVTLNQVGLYFGLRLEWTDTFGNSTTRRDSWLKWKTNDKLTWKEWFDK